eukprot:GHVS01068678.1.p2 GENE.GHVS01068678.1~~GHVS01068678.1.p2  ORF type:complete len:139 (+),score=13.40 GHVS01068678.1:446-862(+)
MSSFGLVLFLQSVVDSMPQDGMAVVTSQALLRTAVGLISQIGETPDTSRMIVCFIGAGISEVTYPEHVPPQEVGISVVDPLVKMYRHRISAGTIEEGFLNIDEGGDVYMGKEVVYFIYRRFKHYQAITQLIKEWLGRV